jgi:hypothetical protein
VQLRHEKARSRDVVASQKQPAVEVTHTSPVARRNVSSISGGGQVHKKGARSIQSLTQGIMNVGRGATGGKNAKR